MTREQKYMVRDWERIAMHMTALMTSAPARWAAIICGDGFRLQIGFEPEDVRRLNTIETLNVRVQADELRERWSYAKNPARGKFFGVKVEDVIELVWQHGGVDLKRSRDATTARRNMDDLAGNAVADI